MVERKKRKTRKIEQDGSDPGSLNFAILRPITSSNKYSIVLNWDNEEVLERLVGRQSERFGDKFILKMESSEFIRRSMLRICEKLSAEDSAGFMDRLLGRNQCYTKGAIESAIIESLSDLIKEVGWISSKDMEDGLRDNWRGLTEEFKALTIQLP